MGIPLNGLSLLHIPVTIAPTIFLTSGVVIGVGGLQIITHRRGKGDD